MALTPAQYAVCLILIVKPGSELHAFAALVKKLAQQYLGTEILFHAAASSLFLTAPDSHLDLVRIGTLLYGQYPPNVPANKRNIDLNPHTFELRSTIVAIDEVPAGTAVGSGREFVCRRSTRVATLPLGYAQGLSLVPPFLARRRDTWWRRLASQQRPPVVLIDGQEAMCGGCYRSAWCGGGPDGGCTNALHPN